MAMETVARHISKVGFNLLFLLLPLLFFPNSSELFEFPKLVAFYLLTIIITASFILSSLKSGLKLKLTGVEMPFLLFLLALFISSLFSIEIRTSLLGYYSRWNGGLLPTICLAILFVIYSSVKDKKLVRTNINSILLSATIVAIWGIFEKLGVSASCVILRNEFSVSCWVQDVQSRVFATFGQPNWMAAYLAMVMPFAIYRAAKAKTNKSLCLYLIIQVLLVLGVIFTRSRSGYLALLVSQILLTVFLLKSKLSNTKVKKVGVVASIAVVAMVTLIVGSPFNKGVIDVEGLTNPPNISQTTPSGTAIDRGGTESGVIRLIVWRGALELFRLNPIVGTGAETFALSYYRARPLEHNNTSEWNYLYNKAHNEFLNYLSTTGVMGTSTYLALLVVSVLLLFRRNSALAKASLSIVVSASVSNFWGFSTVTTSFLMFLAIAIGLKGKDKLILKIPQRMTGLIFVTTIIVAGYSLQNLGKFVVADSLYASGISNSSQDPQKSINDLTLAVQAFPNEPLYIDELANSKLNLIFESKDEVEPSKLEEIDRLLEKSIKLAPNNVKLLKSAIYTYDSMGEIDQKYLLEALKLSSRITLLAPSDPTVYYQIGLTAAKIGDEKSAEDAIKEAIALKPDYKKARQLLAVVYEGQNRVDEAVIELEYILKNISPEDTYVASEIARLTKKS